MILSIRSFTSSAPYAMWTEGIALQGSASISVPYCIPLNVTLCYSGAKQGKDRLLYTIPTVMDTGYMERAPLASAAKTVDCTRFFVYSVVRSNP